MRIETFLDLYQKNPKETKTLTHLNLSDNELTELPPELFKLTNLKCLELDYNRLTELPKEIGRLNRKLYLKKKHF